ncbi:MAG: peptidoglycan-associated lipoprotein Pal [Alphaproteobacteria bacterium]|nr:peptidoglycan-associated lipoprotein Pal [Alphaproteobacteria bacterium]
MRFKELISVFAVVLLLTACASDDEMADPDVVSTESGSSGSGSTSASDLTAQEQLEQIGDRVFFEFNRYNLTPQAQQAIQGWAKWMQGNPAVTVVVEGHADERGTREYNLALGERRADSARNYLVALGVQPGRISVVSYGKERPAVVGSNDYAWAQNRRAVIVVQ